MSPRPQGELTVERLCALASVSRVGYYRHWAASQPRQEDGDTRCGAARGTRKPALWLSSRDLGAVSRRHCGEPQTRIAADREDNLLCLRTRPFVPRTTDSRHEWSIVPNLARGLVLTGIDQLWVADITYVRLLEEFRVLAVVLDAFSRRVIGWALERHLRVQLALTALEMAIQARKPAPGSLIHHSDAVCLPRVRSHARRS